MCDRESFARLKDQTEQNTKQISELAKRDAEQSVQIAGLAKATEKQGDNQQRLLNRLVAAVIGILLILVLALLFVALQWNSSDEGWAFFEQEDDLEAELELEPLKRDKDEIPMMLPQEKTPEQPKSEELKLVDDDVEIAPEIAEETPSEPMKQMKQKLLELAISLFLTKDNAKTLIHAVNERLANVCKLKGKETYIGYTEDAMKELALRAECLSDDGVIGDDELARINAFDDALVDKYWRVK